MRGRTSPGSSDDAVTAFGSIAIARTGRTSAAGAASRLQPATSSAAATGTAISGRYEGGAGIAGLAGLRNNGRTIASPAGAADDAAARAKPAARLKPFDFASSAVMREPAPADAEARPAGAA
jgi:hypothetical protein